MSIFGLPAEREVVDALYGIAAHPFSSVDFVRRTRMARFVSAGIGWYWQDRVLTAANPSRITVFSVALGLRWGAWAALWPAELGRVNMSLAAFSGHTRSLWLDERCRGDAPRIRAYADFRL